MGAKWSNPPIFYTVAQIRFNPILTLKNYVDQVQERLRKASYPDFRKSQSIKLNIAQFVGKPSSEQPSPSLEQIERYSFNDRNRGCGFILDQSSLAFHTTSYETSEDFLATIIEGLKIVHELVSLDYCERIGIRYLDAITPSQEESIVQYVVPEVLGIAGKIQGKNVRHSFSETVVELSDDAFVTSRTIIQNGPIQYPPDIQGLELKLPERITKHDGEYALIDTDAASELRRDFQLEKVRETLTSLHLGARAAFNATYTPYAESIWK
jgi:uncharacterized protein (TIGR04255 family)